MTKFHLAEVGTDLDDLPAATNTAYLIEDNWNDWWAFRTMFYLVVRDETGTAKKIGYLKIGRVGLPRGSRDDNRSGRPEIPQTFSQLGPSFFSVGQDEDYYIALNSLSEDLRKSVLSGLRDLALTPERVQVIAREAVADESILRSVKADTIRGRYARLARGDAQLTPYDFAYKYQFDLASPEVCLDFKVEPDSTPPTNIHAIIGRNGVGKTTCLRAIALNLVRPQDPPPKGNHSVIPEALFTGVVSVSFSAFDPFGPIPEKEGSPNALQFSYVGLKGDRAERPSWSDLFRDEFEPVFSNKTTEDLGDDFVKSVGSFRTQTKLASWRQSLELLEADPLFKDAKVSEFAVELGKRDWSDGVKSRFKRLSAGHKVVLLIVTKLVETVAERTLVLLDEPEAHLHPPLLSALVRSLSELLIRRNGVAIVATHSPVVLQEVPKSCVWILRRVGIVASADRPNLETFGENVGILTREVFGLEVTHTGFHKMLTDFSHAGGGYEEILSKFGGQLGGEARAIARVASLEAEEEE